MALCHFPPSFNLFDRADRFDRLVHSMPIFGQSEWVLDHVGSDDFNEPRSEFFNSLSRLDTYSHPLVRISIVQV